MDYNRVGKNNSNWKGGKTLKKVYYCICGKEIHMSTSLYGSKLCHSCAVKDDSNPNYGNPRKIEGKRHWGYKTGIWCRNNKSYCKVCKKEVTNGRNYCNSCKQLGNKNYNYNKNFNSMFGSSNPRWMGGISFKPYTIEFSKKLKEQIRKRDGYICQKCGLTEQEYLNRYNQVLHVHHIDYNKKNSKLENLISLCNKCNSIVNTNRKYWTDFFSQKITIN